MAYTMNKKQSDSGKAVYIYEENEREIPLNSLYSPEKEVERYLKKLEKTKKHLIIFIGFGNGALLEKLVGSKILEQNFHFIFIEPFSEITLLDSHKTILSQFQEKLSFFYSKDFTSLVFAKYFAKYISVPVSIEMHPNYSKIDNPVIKDCLKVINEGLEAVQIFRNTQAKFAVDWIIEPLLNIHSINKSFNITDLKGKFKNERAILIASGPSLIEHIEFLKDKKDSFYLFSVGSALRALLENEINPDYVLSMDASGVNYDAHFKGLNYNGTLIYETMSNSAIQNQHTGPLIVARTPSDYITSQFFNDLYSFEQASPSVAILTLQVIAYLGFSEVYFVGQDLALVNGDYYATGIKHHDGMIDTKEELMVEDNQGEKVGTTRSLKIFLETFEDLIKKLPDEMNVFNLSERGAKIDGATYILESDITIEKKCNVNIDKKIMETSDNASDMIKKIIVEFQSLELEVSRSRKLLSRLIKLNVVNSNDMLKVVKDFRKVAKHSILERVILSNLTFMFNSIINKIEMIELKKNYMSKDYLELIVELEKFYTLIVQYIDEIIKDERLTPYK